MSNELHVDEGYQHFVSPKRKRMMSPNNCIKISKDQGGSTHVQKHRDVEFRDSDSEFADVSLGRPFFVDNQLASSTSGSPSTTCFIRKPISEYSRRDQRNEKKFGSLKKGNLFGEGDGGGCYSTDDDFDGDVDADDKFERRIRENQETDQGLALKKSFSFGRNFDDNRKGCNQHDTDHELLETDAGTESDYSGVAGKMSALSVGKRMSGFSFPAKRGSPGSSPASSQNSSVNSSIALSPALVMDDLLSAETSSSSRRSKPQQQQRLVDLKGQSLFQKEEMPSRSMRSQANRLISSAILNSSSNSSANSIAAQTPHQSSIAAVPHGSSSSSSSSSSVNNTHINNFHLGRSGLVNHSDHTDALFDTSGSPHADHSMASGASGDSFVHRHRDLEYSGAHSREEEEGAGGGGADDELFDGSRDWGLAPPQRGASLPPRSGGSALARIDETPPRGAAAGAEEEREDGGAAMRYDLNGSPIVTPSRGRRRRGEGSQSHSHSHSQLHSGSMSMSMSLSQQSHEAAMGDLGTPVTEVGSPAVLEGMDDLVGEEDSDDDGDQEDEEREARRRVDSMDDSPPQPRARLNSSLLLGDDKGERDEDPELVMITTMRGSDSLSHAKGRDRRHPRRKISSPTAAGGCSTAGPKSRLFADDQFHAEEEDSEEQQDQDHQYHLFAQQFMVSPTADMAGSEEEEDEEEDGPSEYGQACSPLFHKSRQTSRDRASDSASANDASSSSMSMSLTRTHSGMLSLNRTNSLNLTRTGSDTLMLSRSSNNSSHNSSSNCMDTSITGTSSAFLPLPDQSAFDGPAHADLSRSSYDLGSSYASIDPLFPTPGSARKKRPVQAIGSPSGGSASKGTKLGPPTPLRGLDWGLLDGVSPSGDRKASHAHHRSLKQEAQDQLNATSSSSASYSRASVDGTPHAAHGIAMPGSEESVRSAGSHDSDILVHNRHHHQHHRNNSVGSSIFDASSSESKEASLRYRDLDSPSDSFTSLSARPALVRQSSLLDTKLLLSQAEDGSRRGGGSAGGAGSGSGSSGGAVVSFRSDFEEVGLLGSGTFADVYKVRQVTPGSDPSQYFAVKKSKRQFKSKRDREWLMEEVRTMKRVGQQSACAYVVPFIRAWQEDSYFYVQMGFAERGTLRELLVHLATPPHARRNSSSGGNIGNGSNTDASITNISTAATNGALVPDNTLWHVVHDVTAGLRHIHECGMVHLDIKPANLLITEQGAVQIGDFGMAAPIGSSEDGHEGDTRYMAEELLNNPARQPSADIFSLGITLYEIACFCSEESAAAAAGASAVGSKDSFPLRITPRLGLPQNGPLWHTLRENHAPPVPSHRSPVLQQLLAATMQRVPTARPSTEQILSLADVAATEDDVDPVLLCAPKHADVRRAGNGSMPPYIARSASVQEIMAGGRGSGLGLSVAIGDNNEIDYAALGDGAFTPNFAHSSYSPH